MMAEVSWEDMSMNDEVLRRIEENRMLLETIFSKEKDELVWTLHGKTV